MEYVVGCVLVGLLLAYIGLRIRGEMLIARYDKDLRDMLQARQDNGEINVCRWFVDTDGEWGRVRTSVNRDNSVHRMPPVSNQESQSAGPLPEFLRKHSSLSDIAYSTPQLDLSPSSRKPLDQESSACRDKANAGEYIAENWDYPPMFEAGSYPFIRLGQANSGNRFRRTDRCICHWKWLNKFLNNIRNSCD